MRNSCEIPRSIFNAHFGHRLQQEEMERRLRQAELNSSSFEKIWSHNQHGQNRMAHSAHANQPLNQPFGGGEWIGRPTNQLNDPNAFKLVLPPVDQPHQQPHQQPYNLQTTNSEENIAINAYDSLNTNNAIGIDAYDHEENNVMNGYDAPNVNGNGYAANANAYNAPNANVFNAPSQNMGDLLRKISRDFFD
jgi:hypothetical protein